jgi:hypothetical protein
MIDPVERVPRRIGQAFQFTGTKRKVELTKGILVTSRMLRGLLDARNNGSSIMSGNI